MKKLLALVACVGLVVAGTAAADITVDGSIADWAASDIYTDAVGDGPGEGEIVSWGFTYQSTTQTDPGYLYAYIESGNQTFGAYASGDNDAWPGLWIDVDHYSGPITFEWGVWRTGSPQDPNAAPDYQVMLKGPSLGHAAPGQLGSEWTTNHAHMGIDINAELGINSTHWGEGWNYWGWNDVIGNQGNSIVGGSFAYAGQYLEMQVPIDDLVGEIQQLPDYINGTMTPTGLWKIAARIEASTAGTGVWGTDATDVIYVPIVADADNDGDSDLDDFAVLAVEFGKTGFLRPWEVTKIGEDPSSWEKGDFDLDGDVDLDDFAFLAVTFGKDVEDLGPGGAVPEPVTLVLLGLGGLLLRRRS